mgnify:FL=1
MIPEDHKDDVIATGLQFMRAITEAFGTETGLELWDTIAQTLDPDVKGQMFFAMLTGQMPGRIRVSGIRQDHMGRKVEQIKAIRAVSGWGLKESKDAIDLLYDRGQAFVLETTSLDRTTHLQTLRMAGITCS